MEPEPGNPNEVEGVLNPAAVRGKDGELYLFPRLVSKGNHSRIGIARVQFSKDGDPCGVERLGIALEPETDYEKGSNGLAGCEDPRVTYVKPLDRYVMSYVALSTDGPRVALAISEDLVHWQRLGLATFTNFEHVNFEGVPNKDSAVFPVAIPNPSGHPSLAILTRPLFPGTRPEEKSHKKGEEIDVHRESIWISYSHMELEGHDHSHLARFTSHHRLASPAADWEELKIGVGCPPVLTRQGWLLVYHGVHNMARDEKDPHHLCYSAGVMILGKNHPTEIVYRSERPVLHPATDKEKIGAIANVVFPTGIDPRRDLGENVFDVYYGMADDRIGVARLELPGRLPEDGHRDSL